ncbi:Uncharacterised protein [Yersinia enterocolitica]|nr:Uncharacterised protein [Yersinia enterocolitica]
MRLFECFGHVAPPMGAKMLSDFEQEELSSRLHATAEALGHEIKSSLVMLMVDDLSDYPYDEICKALARVRKEHVGKLTLKAIIDRMQKPGTRPAANEAWALSLPAQDESNTVVWTDEMSQAWAVALPVLESGDKVGARMAFIQTYERLVTIAEAENKSPCWRVSQGWDTEKRVQAITTAQNAGLLPAPIANKYLPSPNVSNVQPSKNGQARVQSYVSALLADIQQSREQRIREHQKRLAREQSKRQERLKLFEQQRKTLEARFNSER